MLTGKRALMAHDPPSIGKTYADTFLLLLPDYNNGTIEGKDIPVRPGYYKYTGKVHIAENKLTVALSVVNTDNKNLDPLTWNGTYSLKRH
jgi:hypothetical protein